MLTALRNWSKRYFSPSASQTTEQLRQHHEESRDRRAQSVSALQQEIHRIQHEISTLNDTITGSSVPSTETQQSLMASLHRELAARQRELGTYQARI